MKTIRFFRLVMLRIVILTILAILWSYLTQYIQESTSFFGDIQYQKYSYDTSLTWDWGWRHYIWNTMGVLLLIASIIKNIVWGDWYWTQIKKEDNVDLKSPENKLF